LTHKYVKFLQTEVMNTSAASTQNGGGQTDTVRDCGYTLMELLLVVVILGVLTSVVALAVTGMSTEAAATGCLADSHLMHVAAEAFFAQTGNDTIPATGTDNNRYETTLVDGGFLRAPSSYHDLTPTGTITIEEGSSC
jgi:prepilin-type N-terminal cleavage/methylation domain-containing protein